MPVVLLSRQGFLPPASVSIPWTDKLRLSQRNNCPLWRVVLEASFYLCKEVPVSPVSPIHPQSVRNQGQRTQRSSGRGAGKHMLRMGVYKDTALDPQVSVDLVLERRWGDLETACSQRGGNATSPSMSLSERSCNRLPAWNMASESLG